MGLGGLTPNIDEALLWCERSAAAGSVEGVMEAAAVYEEQGRLKAAASGYERTHAGWHAAGALVLAGMYLKGKGLPMSKDTAERLLKEAAAGRDHSVAQKARQMLGDRGFREAVLLR